MEVELGNTGLAKLNRRIYMCFCHRISFSYSVEKNETHKVVMPKMWKWTSGKSENRAWKLRHGAWNLVNDTQTLESDAERTENGGGVLENGAQMTRTGNRGAQNLGAGRPPGG